MWEKLYEEAHEENAVQATLASPRTYTTGYGHGADSLSDATPMTHATPAAKVTPSREASTTPSL